MYKKITTGPSPLGNNSNYGTGSGWVPTGNNSNYGTGRNGFTPRKIEIKTIQQDEDPPPPPPLKPKPRTPKKTKKESKLVVKIATSNLFLDQAPTDEIQAAMIQAFFEDFGGEELSLLDRGSVMVNGQTINTTIIANHGDINLQYNPQSMMGIQGADREYFKDFSISLSSRIPNVGDGIDFSGNLTGETVYIDLNDNIVIDTKGLAQGERVEVEFLTFDSVNDATIYT